MPTETFAPMMIGQFDGAECASLGVNSDVRPPIGTLCAWAADYRRVHRSQPKPFGRNSDLAAQTFGQNLLKPSFGFPEAIK